MTKNYALNRNRNGEITRNLSYWAKLKTAAPFLFFMLLFMGTGSRLHAQDWDQIIKTTASDRAADDWFGLSVSISGDYAIVGVSREDEDASGGNTMSDAGSAYIFKNIDGVWIQQQKIVASDRAVDDRFGVSVSISGDYAIVGASSEDHDASGGGFTIIGAGSAYIFKNIDGVWIQQQKIVASDRSGSDFFGESVSISGDYVIVGAVCENHDASGGNVMVNAGSAYIFKNNSGTWTQHQKIVAFDRAADDYFGESVSISGDYAIVGTYREDEDASGGNTMSGAGSAYIFKNNSGTWTQQQKIVASDRALGDGFGISVCISGDYAIVGTNWEDEDASGGNTMINAGSAYIFYNNAGTWEEQQKIVASDRAADDYFGESVSISGDYAIVGASREDEDASGRNKMSGAGSAYIFKNNSGTWAQQQKIVASDRALGDGFGYSVSIFGDYAIVGAYGEDEDASGGNTINNSGSAYFFKNVPKPEINIKQSITPILDAGSFDFGNVDYGNNSGSVSFTIENSGIVNLILSGSPKIEILGTNAADFSIEQTSVSSPVLPAGSTDFSITFTPVSGGLRTAEISIANNDPDENPFTFSISGTCVIADQAITFGTLADKTYGDGTYTVSASGGASENPVVFTSSDPTVATCTGTNGTIITIVGAGTCDIRANQAGNTNYNAATQVAQSLTVNQKELTVLSPIVSTKNYDGNVDAIITGTLTGIVSTDEVTLSGTGNFASANAGTGITVTSTSTLGGANSGNYTLTQPTGLSGNITAKALTIASADASDKVYDGNTVAAITGSTLSGVISGDDVTLSDAASGTFAQATTGTGISVSTSMTLSGVDAGNYTLTQPTLIADIAAKELTVTDAIAADKVYDGNTDATITGSTLSGVVSGDDVTLSNAASGTFAQATTGTDISISTSMTLSGGDAGNYSLTQPTLTADIAAKALTITAENKSKEYDGTIYSPFTVSYSGFINGEDETDLSGTLTYSGTATTATDVGTAYVITPAGLTSTNYDITFENGSLDITLATQTITFDALEAKVEGDAPFELTASSTSGLSISYTSSDPDVATISGSTVTIVGTGTTNITASQSGNDNFSPALAVEQMLTVHIYIAGDTDRNGSIDGTEIAGDADGSGSIDGTEISGDADGSGSIDGTEIAGDADGSGSIDGTEISGDTNGNGSIDGTEISGDTDGSGSIDGTEIAGDVDGSGSIDGTEISGDTNGNGSIDGTEISGDADGSGSIDGTEISGDTNGNGSIDGTEITGDVNGNGSIDGTEISGDADGSGLIDGTEITGDTNGSGSIDGTEISGDADGSGSIDGAEISGDADGSGSIDGTEISGDADGSGSIDGTEIAGDADGSGSIDGTEISGDTDGSGSIDGTEISGDADGSGSIDGTEISGDTNGNGSIDGTEISGDTDGSGSIDGTEIAGDVDGSGSIDGTEISGDTNGNGSIDGTEISGDADGSGSIDGTEISGDTNGNGSIDGTEITGDVNGNGSIDGTEISGDADGSGSIDGTEISGDTDGSGSIDGTEISGDTDGSGSIDGTEIAGDADGNGSIDGTEIAGDTDGSGSIEGIEITGDVNGDGSIDGTEIAGDADGNGSLEGAELTGVTDELGTESFEVTMYPNPARGIVNLDITTTKAHEVTLTVIDITGRALLQKQFSAAERITFDMSGEVSGIYFVKLDFEGKQVLKKLVVE